MNLVLGPEHITRIQRRFMTRVFIARFGESQMSIWDRTHLRGGDMKEIFMTRSKVMKTRT